MGLREYIATRELTKILRSSKNQEAFVQIILNLEVMLDSITGQKGSEAIQDELCRFLARAIKTLKKEKPHEAIRICQEEIG